MARDYAEEFDVSFKLEGSGNFRRRMKKYEGDTIEAVSDAVAAVALMVQSSVEQSMHDAKSGKVYELSSPKRAHRASAPGEAPAVDIGTLVASIMAQEINPYTWSVGTVLPYGRYLEYGTTTILPRPWLSPAIERHRDGFNRLLSQALRDKGI